MCTSFRCARRRVAAGRAAGWPAALAVSLLCHTGLALFTAPLGLARQVLPDRPLRVDWRRSPAPVAAPTVAVTKQPPSPPVNPPPPTRPPNQANRPLIGDRSAAPSSVAAATIAAANQAASSAIPAATPVVDRAIVAESSVPPAAAEPPTSPDTAPLADLAALCPQRPAPVYPAAARRRGEEGRVLVAIEIDASGSVARAEVAGSSGSRWLDAAALAAVRSWRCSAARQAGRSVVASAVQPFSFVLGAGRR